MTNLGLPEQTTPSLIVPTGMDMTSFLFAFGKGVWENLCLRSLPERKPQIFDAYALFQIHILVIGEMLPKESCCRIGLTMQIIGAIMQNMTVAIHNIQCVIKELKIVGFQMYQTLFAKHFTVCFEDVG